MNKNFPSVSKQAGFTMIEISIGLVVVGLLLAGVMRSGEFIESSKEKSLRSQIDNLRGAVTLASENSRLKGILGDGSYAYLDESGQTIQFTGSQNGQIDSNAESLSATRWLRNLNLISGSDNDVSHIQNPFGGETFIRTSFTRLNGGVEICATKVPLKTIASINSKIDGVLAIDTVGSVRGYEFPVGGSAANLSPSQTIQISGTGTLASTGPTAPLDPSSSNLGWLCIVG